ncbi:MAG: fasciclin domain-containing protein [Pseudarcicella sp.]|nr:fasciclin domain-containing protein [Pseudarcicella sp.]
MFLERNFFLTLFLFLAISCVPKEEPDNFISQSIVDILSEKPTVYSEFLNAITRLQKVETFKGAGPYTLFVPTNEALSKAGIDLKTKNVKELETFVYHHILGEKLYSNFITNGKKVSLSEANFYLHKKDSSITINGTTAVSKIGKEAYNGIVFSVNIPLTIPTNTLEFFLENNPDFTEIKTLIYSANTSIIDVLKNSNTKGVTVFLPNNDAMNNYYKLNQKSFLLAPANKDFLNKLLLNHIVEGRYFTSDMSTSSTAVIPFLAGGSLSFLSKSTLKNTKTADISTIKLGDFQATNGIVHVIDKVLGI